jgi:hypothetical protein
VTGAAIWSKLTLRLLATITLEANPYRKYAPFPAILNFVKCIQEVVFCEGVQHTPAILPRPPQLCQNGGLSVLSSIGKIAN